MHKNVNDRVCTLRLDRFTVKCMLKSKWLRWKSRPSFLYVSKVEALKEIIQAWGINPEQLLIRNARAEGAATPKNQADIENHQLNILSEQLKHLIRKEAAV
jgi:hypothetical protein